MSNRQPDIDYRPPRLAVDYSSVALVGCGNISRTHLRVYRAIGLDVVVLCDLDRGLAERRREEFCPKATVYDDVDQLLFAGVEVVDVATRPAQRVAIIEKALMVGCHVLSQKPFANDMTGARRLVAVANASGKGLPSTKMAGGPHTGRMPGNS